MDPSLIAVITALVTAIVSGVGILYRAVKNGDFVPGSIYKAQVALTEKAETRADKAEGRADKAEVQAERNTKALREVTNTVKQALDNRAGTGPPNAPR